MALVLAGFDYETAMTENGMGAPPPVVFGWAVYTDNPLSRRCGLVTQQGEWEGDVPPGYDENTLGGVPRLVEPAHVVRALIHGVREAKAAGHQARLVNQNIPFDFAVACNAHPQLIPDVFAAYDDLLVDDPMIREMLIDIAGGSLRFSRTEKTKLGKKRRVNYDLKSIAERRLRRDLDKLTYRKNYWDLVETPLSQWPKGAKDYVVDDVHAALDVYLEQRVEVSADLEDGEVPNAVEQCRAHWALYLMSVWGIRCDPAKTFKFKRYLEESLLTFRKALQATGFIREGNKPSRNEKAIVDFLVRTAATCGFELPRTAPSKKFSDGQVKKSASVIDDLLEALEVDFFVREEGDKREEDEIALDLARQVIETSAKVKAGARVCAECKGEEADTTAAQCATCWGPLKPLKVDDLQALAVLSFHTSTQKLLRTYIPPAEHGTAYPINCHYNPLVETGRASCSKPNLMNLPRAPGVRECYVPRPGMVFSSVDYEALELHTLGQACLTLLGESRLAEALNSGVDPHLAGACEYLLQGISYQDAVKEKMHKRADHPNYKMVKHARNVFKAANFGLPGGLGAPKFVQFCKQSGILITLDEAKQLKANWFAMWPEMKRYFKFVSDSLSVDEDGEEFATVEQCYSARIRGKARYTAACNSYFQGLAADLAKEAMYQLARACYVPGLNPILYGSRTVVFVHDESIMEHPEATAHERAYEQVRIMVDTGNRYCPDVPLKAEPALMAYWTKKAEAVFDANKRLVVYRG